MSAPDDPHGGRRVSRRRPTRRKIRVFRHILKLTPSDSDGGSAQDGSGGAGGVDVVAGAIVVIILAAVGLFCGSLIGQPVLGLAIGVGAGAFAMGLAFSIAGVKWYGSSSSSTTTTTTVNPDGSTTTTTTTNGVTTTVTVNPDGTVIVTIGDGGDGGGGGPDQCVATGTVVSTPNGFKRIESLRPGDMVYSHDLSARSRETAPISSIVSAVTHHILAITLGDEELWCTPAHRLFTDKWTASRDLRVGDNVRSVDGTVTPVIAIRHERRRIGVHNLIVDGRRNYAVGHKDTIGSSDKGDPTIIVD